ncbi:helix-turn-helix transcriptional regulator [Pseudomonas capeferrum]|uniref:helix-turn-helix domain-containing protein n=1 Tax=Pseudomonas capeferrum TaxID=1495066 RepID=UPI0015E3EE73|nr:AraC family transcriptional regulator [Pseudomonas capeferrum]MBA1203307.1 helix-turn-helix transcriptional regulator [Pseudomonas capeferrum]
MTTLITPYQVPDWVHPVTLGGSDAHGWRDVIQRSYQLEALELAGPGIDHYTIILQCSGPATLERRCGTRWQRNPYNLGDVSLLSIDQPAEWRWQDRLKVSHIYLSRALVTRLSHEVCGHGVSHVRLHDLVAVSDPVLSSIATTITAEAQSPAAGGALYAEALATQLAVHLLRHYSSLEFVAQRAPSRLEGKRLRTLHAFIDEHLDSPLSIACLADQAGMGVWAFSRAFKEATGSSPHLYLIAERVKRAQRLLATTACTLSEIASLCGFSDQAHMTRLLKARLGVTPGQLQRVAAHTAGVC